MVTLKVEERAKTKKCGWPLEADKGSQLRIAGKQKSQSYNYKELNSANRPNEQENGSSPRFSKKESSSLITGEIHIRQMTCRTIK